MSPPPANTDSINCVFDEIHGGIPRLGLGASDVYNRILIYFRSCRRAFTKEQFPNRPLADRLMDDSGQFHEDGQWVSLRICGVKSILVADWRV
jgi:hypothetical protein